jgi:hypothetical protein
MEDHDVLARIQALMEEEKQLRHGQAESAHPLRDDEHDRLQTLEEQLDQCWDLLRRRRAREEFGQNPDEIKPQPVETVERYQQ